MDSASRSVGLPLSASALQGNLAVIPGRQQVAVIHKGRVALARHDNDDDLRREVAWSGMDTTITQVASVEYDGCDLLVLVSTVGVQVYDADGLSLLFSHTFPGNADSWGEFHRGIAKVAEHILCIGCRRGEVLTFGVWKGGMDIAFEAGEKLHGSTITGLAGRESSLVAADASGALGLWTKSVHEPMSRVWFIDNYGSACTGLSLWKSLLAVSFGSGHIRIFRLLTGHMTAEVTAHAAWITSLDATESGQLLSVSEDTYVRVWQLDDAADAATIELATVRQVPDMLLVGGKFLGDNEFGITGYEQKQVLIFSL